MIEPGGATGEITACPAPQLTGYFKARKASRVLEPAAAERIPQETSGALAEPQSAGWDAAVPGEVDDDTAAKGHTALGWGK
jgi:hypothetical protein